VFSLNQYMVQMQAPTLLNIYVYAHTHIYIYTHIDVYMSIHMNSRTHTHTQMNLAHASHVRRSMYRYTHTHPTSYPWEFMDVHAQYRKRHTSNEILFYLNLLAQFFDLLLALGRRVLFQQGSVQQVCRHRPCLCTPN